LSEAWVELIDNPHLTPADVSMLHDYLNLMRLRDQAYNDLTSKGLMVEGYRGDVKTSPSYKIFRDASDAMMRLRAALLMTPASRLRATAAGVVTEEPSDDGIEID